MKMLKRILNFGFCFVILCSPFEEKLMAKEPDKVSKSKSFNRLYNNGPEETACNISNLSYWITKTGGNQAPGAIYPRLTEWIVFSDGLVWGGYVHDTIDSQAVSLRVGSQVYLPTGTAPGWIEQAGDGIHPAVRIDPANPRARLYRILHGWENLTPEMPDVIRDAAILNQIDPSEVSTAQAQEVIDQYEQDWNEWPVDLGAPLIDVNGNGSWDQEEGFANADQIIWLVVNDLDSTLTRYQYGSPPIGLEVQITIWAYDQPDASLGQTVFKRFRIINKSGFQIDSMYVAQWVDPDVGFYADDLVGCDIPRSLGFAYSGYATDDHFDNFNLPPSAVGYDFFQGPISYTGNPTDSAIFDFKYRSGYVNLPMTSFGYYSDGSGIDDPEFIDYDGTLQWYNLLKGFIPTTDLANPSPFIVGAGPDRGQPTKFPLSGDPFLQTGDIDAFGDNFAPGDRRMELCSGPFNMAPGDTQEVVVALIGGIIPEPGGNNRNAIAQLKLNDDYAQFLFDHLFKGIPKPPIPAPATEFTELNDKIILNWGSNPNIYNQTEKDDPILGFNFEGYNIYQLPSANATKSQATLVKTFDKVNFITTIRAERFLPEFGDVVTVPVQHGIDSGIQRYFLIDKDYINNQPLYAGSKYYFAVTAYNYNPDPNVPEPSLETALNVKEVIPQPPAPGVRYESEYNSTVTIEHFVGTSDGQVSVTALDPSRVTGNTYEIFFSENLDSTIAPLGQILWNIQNITTGDTILTQQKQSFNLDDAEEQIADGLLIKVAGPAPDFKEFLTVSNGAGTIDPPEIGCFAFNNNGFPLLFNDQYPEGTDGPDPARQQTNGSTWGINHSDVDNPDYSHFVDATTQFTGGVGESVMGLEFLVPRDYEIRFTESGGKGFFNWPYQNHDPFDGFVGDIPFELWCVGDVNDPNDDYQCLPWIFDTDSNGVFNLIDQDHTISGADNDPFTDYFYWLEPISRDQAGYENMLNLHENNPAAASAAVLWAFRTPEYQGIEWGAVAGMMRMVLVNWNGGSVSDSTFPANVNAIMPEEGTTFRIVTAKPNTTEDIFQFTAPRVITDPEIAKEDVDKIKVFPNPYYAYHSQETNRSERFVTFTHLPDKATIRIFNLAGTQVKKLLKIPGDGTGQFFKWDLNNDSGLPVASGFYIAYIDMPDLNKTKAVKFFILQRKIF